MLKNLCCQMFLITSHISASAAISSVPNCHQTSAVLLLPAAWTNPLTAS